MRYLDKNDQYRDKSLTSDALHNLNCYRFLRKIKLPSKSIKDVPEIDAIRSLQKATYKADFPYGALYSSFMGNLEAELSKQNNLQNAEFDDLFISLYSNDNHNLENTYKFIQPLVLNKTASSLPVQKVLEKAVKDQKNVLNPYTPSKAGSSKGRLLDMIMPHFKPSHKTSLSTLRTYQYTEGRSLKELRFGTQGQTQYYKSRVSPLFERFLKCQMNIATKDDGKKITHIYFNNLGKDRSQWSYEGRFEAGLTESLHKIEETHPNVAVITFPADKGLMDHHAFFNLHPRETLKEVQQKLLDIAMESPHSSVSIKDFHISSAVRQLLFQSPSNEKRILSDLINKSFITLGLNEKDYVSPAQSQAVWVHFIKYELPTFIIQTLDPYTFNFSCKDAIDRGGISSAYYNLISSFSSLNPLNRDEFETALHAAPVMVKGRGMNNHLNIIWNTVDQYIQAHYKEISQDSKKQWIIAWRDANCPKERVEELLERRLKECLNEFNSMEKTKEIEFGIQVLQSIKTADLSDTATSALFLDAVVSTYNLCSNQGNIQDVHPKQHYDMLIKLMKAHYAPTARLMENLGKFLISLFTFRKIPTEHNKIQLEAFKNVVKTMSTRNFSASGDNKNDIENTQDLQQPYTRWIK